MTQKYEATECRVIKILSGIEFHTFSGFQQFVRIKKFYTLHLSKILYSTDTAAISTIILFKEQEFHTS